MGRGSGTVAGKEKAAGQDPAAARAKSL